jgi:hypothetical protein
MIVRAAWLRRAVAAVFLAAAALLAACGSRPWWYQGGMVTCAPPAMVRVNGHVTYVGSCAASLVIPAPKVTVHVGQLIDVHMLEEQAGPTGNQLVPLVPLPRSSRLSVLTPALIGSDRATATYEAIRPGHAALASQTSCTDMSHGTLHSFIGSCPIIEVTVIP